MSKWGRGYRLAIISLARSETIGAWWEDMNIQMMALLNVPSHLGLDFVLYIQSIKQPISPSLLITANLEWEVRSSNVVFTNVCVWGSTRNKDQVWEAGELYTAFHDSSWFAYVEN